MVPLRRFSIAGLLLVAVAAGCGGGDEQAAPAADGTFVADVPGSSAQIGVIVQGDEATAYVCDERGSDAAFLTGDLEDGKLTLRSGDGKASLDATASDGGVDGELTLDGQKRHIDAEPASGESGVYYATAQDGKDALLAAWVQDDDGSQTGARFIKLHGDFRIDGPPPPLDTGTGSVILGPGNVKTKKAEAPGFVEQDN